MSACPHRGPPTSHPPKACCPPGTAGAGAPHLSWSSAGAWSAPGCSASQQGHPWPVRAYVRACVACKHAAWDVQSGEKNALVGNKRGWGWHLHAFVIGNSGLRTP
eukprot:1160544-Pelagomonas_calceolata.AAC.1